MHRTAALILLCVLAISAVAGCIVTQQNASDHTSAPVAPTATTASTVTTSAVTVRSPQYRVSVGTAVVDAEAADTPLKQEVGLMNRTDLDPNAGMLFLFSHAEQQGMWMKNMRFPLDIVFITEGLRVQNIYADVPTCAAEPCPTYVSDGPVLYALEVNAGFCAQHNIVPGTQVTITPS